MATRAHIYLFFASVALNCSAVTALGESTTTEQPFEPDPWSLLGTPCPPDLAWTASHNDSQTETLCDISPCENDGICKPLKGDDGRDSYCCNCTKEYYGNNCTFRNPCEDTTSHCANGGSCIPCESNGTQSRCCICADGFGGPTCQTKRTTCDSRPCENGGTCYVDPQGKPKCFCSDGFTGEHCHDANACASRPCQNGGICHADSSDDLNSYHCNCPLGYEGSRCETAPVQCDPPCLKGLCSRPYSGVGAAGCVCLSGYYGVSCDTTNPCVSQPCKNGGNCTTRADNYCICPEGFYGRHCDVRAEDMGLGKKTDSSTTNSVQAMSFSAAVLMVTVLVSLV